MNDSSDTGGSLAERDRSSDPSDSPDDSLDAKAKKLFLEPSFNEELTEAASRFGYCSSDKADALADVRLKLWEEMRQKGTANFGYDPSRSDCRGFWRKVLWRKVSHWARSDRRRRKRYATGDDFREYSTGRNDTSMSCRAIDVQGALARLPDKLRSVVVSVFFEGLTMTETAALLGISRKTVGARLQWAFACLQKELSSYGPPPTVPQREE